MWRAVIIFIILYLVTINIWCRGETHELSQLFTVAGCKRQSAERAADLEIIHNSQPVAHVGAHLALGMDEGVNSSIVLKLPGVQLNRPRAGRLVDFFCRVRAQDKLKYCQPGFAPRLYLLQLPAQHRSHPLKLFPFNVQQRRAQLLKESLHLSRSRHPHHLPVVEQAAHLQHQRQVSGNKSWLTGTTVAAVPVANISSKSPLLQEMFS